MKAKKDNWNNNAIQFPRLIAELEAAGAFSSEVMDALISSMDLSCGEICQIIDRAQSEWDKIVAKTP